MKNDWKDIEGYNGLYKINSSGEIISKRKNGEYKERVFGKCRNGYIQVSLYNKGKQKMELVHRLVAKYFLPIVFGKNEVNHKNGNKEDNRVENLEWCTHSDNAKHMYRVLKKIPVGSKKVMCVETKQLFNSETEAAKFAGVSKCVISSVLLKRKSYKTAGGYHFVFNELCDMECVI